MANPILMVDGGRVSPDLLISRPVSAVLRQKEGLHLDQKDSETFT